MLIVAMVSQIDDYTENHPIEHFQEVNLGECELYLNKAAIF